MTNEDILIKTNDGYVIEIFANKKLDSKIESNVQGIIILEHEKSLVEEEQYNVYKEIVEKMDYNPVVIKVPEREAEVMVLKTQIRALLRASKHGDLSIAFSKISTLKELIEYKEILEECKNELEEENTPYKKHIKIGLVVEIPSAALMSYQLAKECDFLLIETNTLTQYTFGATTDETDLYEKIQPALIKLAKQAIEGAHDAGIFCGICGKILENKLYIPLLIGLGVDQLYMEEKNIPEAKKIISEIDKSDCKELVEEIIQLKTLEDIERKLKQFIKN